MSYPNMENFYPIQIVGLIYQVDHTTPKKLQLMEENRNKPANARISLYQSDICKLK